MHAGPVLRDGVELLHDLELSRIVTVQAGASGHPGITVLGHFSRLMLSSAFYANSHLTNQRQPSCANCFSVYTEQTLNFRPPEIARKGPLSFRKIAYDQRCRPMAF
jgi:hypothetical protein